MICLLALYRKVHLVYNMMVEGKIQFRLVRTNFFHVSVRLNSFTTFLIMQKKSSHLQKAGSQMTPNTV